MGLFDFWKKTPPPVDELKNKKGSNDYFAETIDLLLIPFVKNQKQIPEIIKTRMISVYCFRKLYMRHNYSGFIEAKPYILNTYNDLIELYISEFYDTDTTRESKSRIRKLIEVSSTERHVIDYWITEDDIRNALKINDNETFDYNLDVFYLIFINHFEEMHHYIKTGRKLLTDLAGGQNVRIPEKARQAHTYIIGASKSGKSELIKDLIFSDFEKENKSVILIEPHGDLAEQVAKLKGKNNEKLVYIDFTLDPEKTPVLNPFDIIDRSSENIEIQAQALIDAFEDILGAEFSTQMEELLGATIRTLMQTGKGDFWELRRFMDDENNSDLITAGKASPNPKDRLFFNDGSFNQQSYKPTKNSLKSKIGTYLGYAVFRNFTTGKSTIDLKKLTDGKMWVIINLSKGNIGKKVSPILGRFVIASLQNIILQRAKTTHRTPVYLYIDEFQNYTSETIEEIFSESRKYGFHLTVAHQNTGQLLGKMRDLIFSNTSVKIIGRNDTDQLKKLSNQILVEFGELDKLTTGKFYMRVEKNEAKQIQVGTKLIDNKHSMTAQEWEQVKAEQLEKYYTKIEQHEPPTISEPTSEKFDFNPSDTV